MKKHLQKFSVLFTLSATLICLTSKINAQAWTITGNAGIAAGTNYLGTRDRNDLVFRTNAIERGRLLGSGGDWRFGSATNYVSIDSLGKLKFNGTASYQVGSNKYAFQLAASPNSGLFFNTSAGQYEFRNTSAASVFSINATTGAGIFSGAVKVGAYTLPAADGSTNQVLKTNGAGVLTWSNDNTGSFSGWALTGNTGTSAVTNFIGTTDAVDFVARTANTERLRITGGGNVGIGTTAPTYKLEVYGSAYGIYGSGSSYGTYGYSSEGYGVAGVSDYLGVYGSGSTYGLYGTGGTFGIYSIGNSYGGEFSSVDGYGSYSTSVNGYGSSHYSYNNTALYSYNFNNASYWAGFFVGDVYSSTGVFTGSDQNLKKNIKDLSSAMSIIDQLKPKTYDFRHDGDFGRMNLPQGNHYGLIAQEVEKVLPNLVKTSKFDLPSVPKDGKAVDPKEKTEGKDYKSLNYTELIPILVKGMQEQEQTINNQQKQIDDLKAMLLSLTQGKQTTSTETNSATVNNVKITSAALEQNVPNPLSNSTSIRYSVPAGSVNASLLITDINGKQLKQVILKTGTGIINIDASTLSTGAYSYTLVIDDKAVATKKMIIAR